MIRKAVSALMCLLIIMLYTAVACADESTISDYSIRVSAGDDKVYKVTEELTVDFGAGSHYIEKTIPMDGMKVTDLASKTHDTDLTVGAEGYILKVGNDDIDTSGEETLKFTYTVSAYDEAEGKDIFDITLIPDGWGRTIKNFKAHINLPDDFSESSVKLVSAKGDSLSGSLTAKVNNTAIDITGTDVTAEEGLRCQVSLPENYWNSQSTYEYLKWILAGIFVLIPLLIFVFWITAGRDPKKVKGEYYYPPEGMTPVELGYIIDGQTDQQDAASMVIYFAQKGYVRIEEYEKGKIRIEKVMDIPKDEKPFAKTLFEGMFQNRSSMKIEELDREFGEVYMDAKKQIRKYYSSGGRHLFTRKSKILRSISVILSMVPAAALVIISAVYRMSLKEALIAVPVILFILIGGFMITRAFDRKYVWSSGKRIKKYVIGGLFLIAANGGAAWYAYNGIGINYAIGLIASAAAAEIFITLLKARTVNSAHWLDQITGLKTFMKAGDVNAVKLLETNNPGYCCEMLSHAYALGVMSKWAKTVHKVDIPCPDWYKAFGEAATEPLQIEGEAEAPEVKQPEVKQGFLTRVFGGEKAVSRKGSFDVIAFAQTLEKELGRLSDGITEKADI